MKKIIFLLVVLITNNFIAQNLNEYKYIIIPNTFDFLKSENQYKLNSLAKFLFEKEDFKTLYKKDKSPTDLYNNDCLGLQLNLIKKGLLFTTIIIELKDCNNKVVFTSVKGKSNIKEYKRAYHEALRNAFASVKNLNYKYNNVEVVKKKIKLKDIKITKEVVINKETSIKSKVLYAQKTENGYQLVDNKPSIKYILINSGLNNVFHLQNKNGIIYKKNEEWYMEINSNNRISTTKLNVKF